MHHGALAHLGERLLCKQKVTGSSPVCSKVVTRGVSVSGDTVVLQTAISGSTPERSIRNLDLFFMDGLVIHAVLFLFLGES